MGGYLQADLTEFLPWGEDGKAGMALTVHLARNSGQTVVECGGR